MKILDHELMATIGDMGTIDECDTVGLPRPEQIKSWAGRPVICHALKRIGNGEIALILEPLDPADFDVEGPCHLVTADESDLVSLNIH